MKNLKNIFLIGLLVSSLFSCESDDEKYSGTPVGNQEIIVLTGNITTDATAALTNQKIPFTVELPRAFADTVAVEVSTVNRSGGRSRVSVNVMPNETTAIGEVNCAGGELYNSTVDMYISALNLQTAELGKHYLINSNTIVLDTGNTTVPGSDDTRLQVKFAWPDPDGVANNLRLTVVKPNNTTTIPSLAAGARQYNITNVLGANGALGDYYFKIRATALTTSPIDMPYRFILRFPNGSSKLFQGVFEDLTTASSERTVLKVTKSTDPVTNQSVYVVTDQGL